MRLFLKIKTGVAIICFAGMLTMSGCQTLQASSPVEALIEEYSEGSFNELAEVISTALGAPVTLSRTAFSKNSHLVIERKMQQLIQYGVIEGKQLKDPPVFVLTLTGEECRLTYRNNQQSWLLKKSQCVAKHLNQ